MGSEVDMGSRLDGCLVLGTDGYPKTVAGEGNIPSRPVLLHQGPRIISTFHFSIEQEPYLEFMHSCL